MSLEDLRVKEEPEWDNVGEFGVSEAAALAGLYTDHRVKDEMVVGPEVLQPPDAAYTAFVVSDERQLGICKSELMAECAEQWELQDSVAKSILVKNTIKCERDPNPNRNWHSRNDNEISIKKDSNDFKLVKKKKIYICDICNIQLSIRQKFITHLQSHTGKPYECDVCRKKLCNGTSLEKHKLLHKRTPFHCAVCSKKFVHKSFLMKHKLIHTVGKLPCEKCYKTFANQHSLARHQLIHAGERPLSCDISKKEDFVIHKKERTGEHFYHCKTLEQTLTMQIPSECDQIRTEKKKFTCDICDKRYSRLYELTCHKRTHTNPIQCKICNKKFASKKNLSRHEVIHSETRQGFSCEICNKQIMRENNYESHKLIHTGEKPFSCGICEKKFRLKEGLIYHTRRIHPAQMKTDQQRPNSYACDLCERKFIIESHLIRHKRIHTGDKPFRCEICEKRFRHKETLSDHVRTHTGAKPYACHTCGHRFTTNSNMNKHKRTHAKYYCDLCCKGFMHKGTLMRHIIEHMERLSRRNMKKTDRN